MAAVEASKDQFFARNMLDEMGFEVEKNIRLGIDNHSTIKLAKDACFHGRAKHINVRWHLLRSKVDAKEAQVHYVPSALNTADLFTKTLDRGTFVRLRDKIMTD